MPPFSIPAGASETLECDLEVLAAGDFSAQIHVFVDDNGLREIILTVAGQAQGSGRK